MTNFPSGFAAGLSLRGLPLLQTQPGNVFWVDNSPTLSGGQSHNPNRTVAGSDSNPGTYQRPFASLYYAISQCQQGNGDIIFVKPGHQEIVNGAATTVQVKDPTQTFIVGNGTKIAFDVNGVAIIGLGYGAMRPTLYFTTAATANIPVRAGGMSIQNFVFAANFADIASIFTNASASATSCTMAANVLTVGTVTGTIYVGMNVYSATGGKIAPGTVITSQLTGTANGTGTYAISVPQTVTSGTFLFGTQEFNIENCEFRDSSSALNFLTVFTGAATNANSHDGFRFANNRVLSQGTTAATTALKPVVAGDRWQIKDNFGVWAALNDTAAMIAAAALNMTNFDVGRNVIFRPNTSTSAGNGLLMSNTGTAFTGILYDNYAWHLAASGLLCGVSSKLGFVNNFCSITGAADKSALVNPAAV